MKLKIQFVYLVVFAVLLVTSCKKIDTTEIGGDLIPAVDNITTFDTVLEVFTDNFLLNDSSRVLRSDAHAFGVIDNDPEFGKTRAELFFSVTPPSYGTHPFPKKDSTLIIDSVVLALSYSSIFGDTNSIQKMDVFEISLDAPFANNFAGYRVDNNQIFNEPGLLGSKLLDFRTLNDSVFDIRKKDTLRIKNQLRIPINKSLANRFLSYDTSNAYKNDSLFRTNFKGFALKVDEAGSPVKKALSYYNLSANDTKLIFYYRVKSGSLIVDTIATEFGFYSFNGADADLITRTPANSYLAMLNNGNNNDDKIYLQSSPGSYASVRIPGIKGLSNRIIHRAELLFEALPALAQDIYPKPAALFLDVEDTANKRIATVPYDFNFATDYQTLFGGLIRNDVYSFNISRYVQSIVTRKEKDFTLRLYAPFVTRPTDYASGLVPTGISINKPIAAGRLVLTGGSYSVNPSKRARLRIIYSKI